MTFAFGKVLDDCEELTFIRNDDGVVDDQTASRWNMLGQAIDGPWEALPSSRSSGGGG